jgi:hypothetical protein
LLGSRNGADQADFGKFFICLRDVTARQDSAAAFNGYKDTRAKNSTALSYFSDDQPDRKIRDMR